MERIRLIGSAVTESGQRVKVICHIDQTADEADYEREFFDHCHSNGMGEPHFFEGVIE